MLTVCACSSILVYFDRLPSKRVVSVVFSFDHHPTSCRIPELLRNKLSLQERKKKGRSKQLCVLDVEQFRTLAILQQVLTILIVVSSAKIPGKSLYKQNKPVHGKHTC